MKNFVFASLMLLMIFVFCGTASAESKNSDLLLAKTNDPLQTGQGLKINVPDPKTTQQTQVSATDSEIVKRKIGRHFHPKPRYCRPLYEFWCHQLCTDVSPSKPGGSQKWGKNCTRSFLSKCEKCDFVP